MAKDLPKAFTINRKTWQFAANRNNKTGSLLDESGKSCALGQYEPKGPFDSDKPVARKQKNNG